MCKLLLVIIPWHRKIYTFGYGFHREPFVKKLLDDEEVRRKRKSSSLSSSMEAAVVHWSRKRTRGVTSLSTFKIHCVEGHVKCVVSQSLPIGVVCKFEEECKLKCHSTVSLNNAVIPIANRPRVALK
ncbi:hypothetical protein TNCV_4414011 [Trichonephila clavipes]|uniref:Uncharacterized protein n=1 Tax=Trichonephila clavipes TaxID=2585209 RepID=A0A8X6VDW5_TRICX|nr:hypothetical protein TNCV_4414011 [Trichonephila clavipes]